MQVLTGGTADSPLLTTARKPITIRHLLTHRSGLYYDFIDDPVLSEIFKRTKPVESPTLTEFVKRAASLPLKHQPGERRIFSPPSGPRFLRKNLRFFSCLYIIGPVSTKI